MIGKPWMLVWLAIVVPSCSVDREGPLSVAPPPDVAPTFLALDLPTLAAATGLVVIGDVSAIEHRTDPDTRLPHTWVTLRQVEVVVDPTGSAPSGEDRMILRLFGGMREDGLLFRRIPMPEFELGGRYVVFIRAGSWSESPVAGTDVGLFRLFRTRTGEPWRVLDHAGRPIVGITPDGRFELARATPPAMSTSHVEVREDRWPRWFQRVSAKRTIYTEEGVKDGIPAPAKEDPAPRPTVPHLDLDTFLADVRAATFSTEVVQLYPPLVSGGVPLQPLESP